MNNKPLLQVIGISKRFGGTQALREVSLEVVGGEVHALVGQNGSGKSTLIKILAGYHSADSGSLELPHVQPIGGRSGARKRGLAFLHQDLALALGLSVLENIRVDRYTTGRFGRLLWSRERELSTAALESVGLGGLSTKALVRDLGPSVRALIALARAFQDLSDSQGVLVLDEPTAYLPESAVKLLFAAVRRLAASGSGILFVTHRLDEVFQLADRVTVIRNGEVAGTYRVSDTSRRELVAVMLGKELDHLYPDSPVLSREGNPVLSVQHIGGSVVRDFTLDLWPGEIVGITGLLGMGHDEVPGLLFGEHRARTGSLTVDGVATDAATLTPAKALVLGLAYLPADRSRSSGLGSATVRENMTLPSLDRFWRGGVLRGREERDEVGKQIMRYMISAGGSEALLSSLSGGNQQKLLLAKWLELAPRVLLLHEPTQGVDIGARKEIFRIMRESAERGMSILISSSEYEDLANLCDRVLIIRRGRIVRELRGAELTEARIVEQCYLAD